MTSARPEIRAVTNGFRPSSRQRAAGYVLVVAAAAAGVLAYGLWGEHRPRRPGVPGPGALTEWGLPLSRTVVVVAAVGTIGMLVTSLLLPREDGALGTVARRCLRSAAWLALTWAVATAALLLFGWSSFTGVPVSRATRYQVFSGPHPYPDARPYLYAAVLAAIVAVAALVTRKTGGVVLLLVLSGYNLLPLTARGNEVHGTLTGFVVTAHVAAVALWVGGLAGLLVHVRRVPELLAVAVPRFSRLALGCYVVVAVSGLAAAWVNLGSVSQLRGSHYGMLVVYEVEALAVLGLLGWWHRRRTVPGFAGARARQVFTRFAAVEVVVMAAAIALGVALSQTPAPAAPAPVTPTHQPYTGVV